MPRTNPPEGQTEFVRSSETFTTTSTQNNLQSIPRVRMRSLGFEISGTMTGRCIHYQKGDEPVIQEIPRRHRTVIPETPVQGTAETSQRSRRTKIGCFWICPCGGTVPDVPTWCRFAILKGRGGRRCADVASCLQVCKQYCEAYHNFRDALKARKVEDLKVSAEKERAHRDE